MPPKISSRGVGATPLLTSKGVRGGFLGNIQANLSQLDARVVLFLLVVNWLPVVLCGCLRMPAVAWGQLVGCACLWMSAAAWG